MHMQQHVHLYAGMELKHIRTSAARPAAPAAAGIAEFAAQVPAARARLPAAHYAVCLVLLLLLCFGRCLAT
jgi:hypothetical protein